MATMKIFKWRILTKLLDPPSPLYLLKKLSSGVKRFKLRRLIKNKQVLVSLKNGTVELKLDVCGGKFPYRNGYLNVDIQKLPEVDIVTNISKEIPFPDNCIAEIFSCGTLEHFSLNEIRNILKEFYRILKLQGKLIIGVPSLKKICNAYVSNDIDFETLNQYLYGAQKSKYDLHKCIFDFDSMKLYLKEIGFCEIEEIVYDLPLHIPKYMMKIVCKKI